MTNTNLIEKFINRQSDIFQNKIDHGFNVTNPYIEVRYMTQELAELMKAIEHDDKANILEELADIVIFAYGLAGVTQAGNLDEAIFQKMEINSKRKYTTTDDGDFVKIKE